MKNIVIAGANGFIGTALVKRLLLEDVHIWTLERDCGKAVFPVSEKITRIKDMLDIQDNKKILNGKQFDSFYNLAWQGVNGIDKTKYEVQINNIKMTVQYAELAQSLGCKKFLCAGTIAEHAIDSIQKLKSTSGGMLYSAAKLCTRILLETYCKNIGLNFVWMQFANIFGPNNKTGNLISYTIEKLKKNEAASFGPAKQPYDFLYIDDLIEAICRLGINETRNDFYYIGSGTPKILKDYLKIVGELFGRPELIHIGEREDDGIVYSYDMLDISETVADIGNYITDSFENHIRSTIKDLN